jgi:hypothetical protein
LAPPGKIALIGANPDLDLVTTGNGAKGSAALAAGRDDPRFFASLRMTTRMWFLTCVERNAATKCEGPGFQTSIIGFDDSEKNNEILPSLE